MLEEDSVITFIIKEKKLRFAEIKIFARVRKMMLQSGLS